MVNANAALQTVGRHFGIKKGEMAAAAPGWNRPRRIEKSPAPAGVGLSICDLCEAQTALVTLPERKHRVQTYTWRGVPFTIALTRFTLGFQGRLDRLWEWET